MINGFKHASDPSRWMRSYREGKRAAGLCWECSADAEPGRSRCTAHADKRSPGRLLDALDVYDLAVARFGDDIGVWSPADGTCFVGRWIPLDPVSKVVLCGRLRALLVIGEGSTWIAAWDDACSKVLR